MGGGNPFSGRLMGALAGAGILAFAVFMVLMAYTGDFRAPDGRAHALSVSAVGFQGVVKLIGLAGGKARLVRDDSQWESEDLLVAALEPMLDPEAVTTLTEEREGKATLLILPKWSVMADPARKGWVRGAGRMPAGMTEALLLPLGKLKLAHRRRSAPEVSGSFILDGVSVPLPPVVQTIQGEGVRPMIAGPGGGAVLAQLGDGSLFILADPDLLNNMAMKDPRSARAALAILEGLNSTGAEAVAFDLTLNGFVRRPNALKLAFEPPFLALTLAVFIAALLAGLHGAFRFGPAAEEGRAIAFGKAALVENSAGLFRIARREHRTGGAYAEMIREEAARASGAHTLRGADLDSYLDRLSPAGRPRFSSLAEQAATAADRDDLVVAARALFLWKKDLIQ
jgi:hypothetical protein